MAGHWLLIENIDRASQDVISLLSPLVHCPREEAWLPDKLMTDLRASVDIHQQPRFCAVTDHSECRESEIRCFNYLDHRDKIQHEQFPFTKKTIIVMY